MAIAAEIVATIAEEAAVITAVVVDAITVAAVAETDTMIEIAVETTPVLVHAQETEVATVVAVVVATGDLAVAMDDNVSFIFFLFYEEVHHQRFLTLSILLIL